MKVKRRKNRKPKRDLKEFAEKFERMKNKGIVLHGRREHPDYWLLEKDGVSQSSLSLWLRCREQFRLIQSEGLRTLGGYRDAIEHGNLWHWLHERRFQGKIDPSIKKELGTYVKTFLRESPDCDTPGIRRKIDLSCLKTQALWPEYVKWFDKSDADKEFTGVEEPFRVKIRMERQPFTFRGIFDGVCVYRNGLWLVENKTYSRIDPYLEDCLQLNLQVMLYLNALWQKHKAAPQGVVYNIIRNPSMKPSVRSNESYVDYVKRLQADVRKRPDHYFVRYYMKVKEDDLKAWRHEVLRPIMLDMKAWANGSGPHYMNPTALVGPYGKCAMFEYMTRGSFDGLQQVKRERIKKDFKR